MTTLKELAKLLNISVSTVSKALNDSHEISENTKRRVNELADKLNYKPNRIAQQLKSNKTKTIGV
ncbi:MAG: LacI family DNA-binding transcriptional regulator, partial [Winogradskyella sp.]|nr:LacI family DNA-binding transcriptional regulator [Winogradskyella sp.]